MEIFAVIYMTSGNKKHSFTGRQVIAWVWSIKNPGKLLFGKERANDETSLRKMLKSYLVKGYCSLASIGMYFLR